MCCCAVTRCRRTYPRCSPIWVVCRSFGSAPRVRALDRCELVRFCERNLCRSLFRRDKWSGALSLDGRVGHYVQSLGGQRAGDAERGLREDFAAHRRRELVDGALCGRRWIRVRDRPEHASGGSAGNSWCALVPHSMRRVVCSRDRLLD